MRRALAFSVLLATTIGCRAPEEEPLDAVTVYIMPKNCSGAGYHGSVCPQGDYPEDTSFTVIYEVGVVLSELEFHTCELKQTGEFELTVHTAWKGEDDIFTSQYFECGMTPELAAGTWTIRHGDSTGTLVVPSTKVWSVCVWGAYMTGDDCTERNWEGSIPTP